VVVVAGRVVVVGAAVVVVDLDVVGVDVELGDGGRLVVGASLKITPGSPEVVGEDCGPLTVVAIRYVTAGLTGADVVGGTDEGPGGSAGGGRTACGRVEVGQTAVIAGPLAVRTDRPALGGGARFAALTKATALRPAARNRRLFTRCALVLAYHQFRNRSAGPGR